MVCLHWTRRQSDLKAGRLLLSELRALIARGESVGLESTLSGRTYIRLFAQAKERGYSIELHFIWIPDPREAIRRVRQRVREGGHDVPAIDIRRRFGRGIQHVVNDYAPLADRWAIWDNSTPAGKLVATSHTHSIVHLTAFFGTR
ncbi:MAG: hypothetical protein H0X73_13925 [Chthoniobacterales bacterium]|nr:hypothetical protein [Chthoniobacterales bacterium]